jgi:hypothetical protein
MGEWIILKWILERKDGVVWATLILLRIGTSGNETSGSIKCWKVLE